MRANRRSSAPKNNGRAHCTSRQLGMRQRKLLLLAFLRSAAPSISAGVINSAIIHPFLWLNSRMKDDIHSATADIPRDQEKTYLTPESHYSRRCERAHRFQRCLSKRRARECENEKLICRYICCSLSRLFLRIYFLFQFISRSVGEGPDESGEDKRTSRIGRNGREHWLGSLKIRETKERNVERRSERKGERLTTVSSHYFQSFYSSMLPSIGAPLVRQ